MHHKAYIAFLLLAVVTTSAQETPRSPGVVARAGKAAWQWTDDERLAVRLDASAARARVNEAMSRRAGSGRPLPMVEEIRGSRPSDVIVGAEHPELFLPHELFRQLMDTAFGAEDATAIATREAYKPELRKLHLPDDFWDVLAAQSGSYIIALRAERRVRDAAMRGETNGARFEEALTASCRARAAALRNARETFGREKFDRFLYEAFAPSMTSWWPTMPDAQRLRREEAGCP